MNRNMDCEIGYEDIDEEGDGGDVFYAELRRRILLLMADEDEGLLENGRPSSELAAKKGSKKLITGSYCVGTEHGSYSGYWGNENSGSIPSWLVDLWRSGNVGGTGVFIPSIGRSRRRIRPGKKKRRMQKQVEKQVIMD